MNVAPILVIAWFVLIVFWLVNHYHTQNVKYELEYRNGKHPHW